MDIIAHRGLGKPENTISSFQRAVEKGFPYVELDVHLTKDGKWVVFHDFKIGDKKVEELSYQEISKMVQSELQPPLLEEVLDFDHTCKLNIELKVPSSNDNPQELGKKLGKFLESEPSIERINVSSFNEKALIGIRSILRNVKISYLSFRSNPRKWDQLNRKLKGLYSVNPLFILLRKKHVDKAHKWGILVHPWTVNREKWIKRMIKIGVDGIITDYPERVYSILHSLSSNEKYSRN